jgi:hypothetical protein
MEEVKQALEILKKECTKQDDCEGCSISKVLGYSCQEVAIPEEMEKFQELKRKYDELLK